MTRPSLERSLLRTYVVAVVGVAVSIVVVGAVATTAVVVGRDDEHAVALARTLGTEIRDNRDGTEAELDELVAHELEEQHWFDRTIEVWRGSTRVGGPAEVGRLGAWATHSGCAFDSRGGGLERVCVARVEPATAVVVSSRMWPLLLAELPVVGAIAFSAFLAAAIFAVAARRLVRRDLAPLRAFERRLSSLGALEAQTIATAWGAAEIDDLARAFDALLGRIHAAVTREHRFVSNAAHELRTPLTRLRGQIDLVAAQVEADGDASRRLGLAARSCEDLASAIDALLALARDQADTRETVDLGEVTSEVVRTLGEREAARLRLEAEVTMVRGDPRLLFLALRNLIDNALAYSDGKVWVRIGGGADRSEAEVLDEGPGIPEGELVTVREPFERGSLAASRARGTGLGLSLVDHIARLHQGTLLLENAEPCGLRAILSFPRWEPLPDPLEGSQGASR